MSPITINTFFPAISHVIVRKLLILIIFIFLKKFYNKLHRHIRQSVRHIQHLFNTMYICVSFVADTYKQHFTACILEPVITATRSTWCIIIFLTCQIFCSIFPVTCHTVCWMKRTYNPIPFHKHIRKKSYTWWSYLWIIYRIIRIYSLPCMCWQK